MAFTIANWSCISTSLSQGPLAVTPFLASSAVTLNSPNVFTYGSPIDTASQIAAANYFLPQYLSLSVGDIIWGYGTDASFGLQVTAVSSTTVTTASFVPTGSVGTANIVNNAVTFAKFQQLPADTLLANPTGSLANAQPVTLGNGLSYTGTVLGLNSNLLNFAEVTLTASQFNGMYAAPVVLIAAPGANNLIVIDKMVANMTYGAANFAAGGLVAAQYGNTVHGAGPFATNTEAAADFFAASSTSFLFSGVTGALPYSTTVNQGVYLSNQTGAFTNGDSTFTVKAWYKIVPTNS